MTKPIEFKHVSKHFEDGIIPKRVHILKDVSFQIETGKTYAYLGPNGAGKTTTIKLLLNFLWPSSGEINIFGQPVETPDIKSSIGYVSDHPYFYEYLSAVEYLSFCGKLYRMNPDDILKRTEEMLAIVGLEAYRNLKIRKYSRGMGQRLSFAQALMHNPQLIILDEPLNGLDPFGRKDLRNVILDLKTKGKTIFFSSHILDDAEQIADQIILINKGEIIFEGGLTQLKKKQTSGFSIVLEQGAPLSDFCKKHQVQCKQGENSFIIPQLPESLLYDFLEIINENKLKIITMEKTEPKLEDLFMDYYRGTNDESN